MSTHLLRYLRSLTRDLERLATFQYDQEPSSPEQYEVWDRRFEENNSHEVFDAPIVNQPREPYYQYQLYGKSSSLIRDPAFWTVDPSEVQEDEGMWIDSTGHGSIDLDGDWDVFAFLDDDEEAETASDTDKEGAPRRRPSKPSAYRKYRQYWRKNRQKYREKKRQQRMQYKRKKNKILRRRKILKRRTPGRIRKPTSF